MLTFTKSGKEGCRNSAPNCKQIVTTYKVQLVLYQYTLVSCDNNDSLPLLKGNMMLYKLWGPL
jgi:hypothetical protein